jgi:hypothetical protein
MAKFEPQKIREELIQIRVGLERDSTPAGEWAAARISRVLDSLAEELPASEEELPHSGAVFGGGSFGSVSARRLILEILKKNLGIDDATLRRFFNSLVGAGPGHLTQGYVWREMVTCGVVPESFNPYERDSILEWLVRAGIVNWEFEGKRTRGNRWLSLNLEAIERLL